jgi:glycosidase
MIKMKKCLLFTLVILAACQKNQTLQVPEQSQMPGLAAAFTLPVDTGRIFLQDYFPVVSAVDSIGKVKGLEIIWNKGKESIQLKVKEELAPVSILPIYSGGYEYALPLFKSVKQKVIFEYKPLGDHKSVKLAGDINNWQPDQTVLAKNASVWKTELILNPGRYSYQVVLDGVWSLDKNNPDSTSNGMGGFNSVLKIEAASADALPVLFTNSTKKGQLELGFENKPTEIIAIWDNFRLPADFIKLSDEKASIRIPDQAKNSGLSFIRVFSWNEHGRSNDLLIPLNKGEVVTSTANLPRNDFRKSIMYFMLVDRFFDGDTLNNKPVNDSRVDFRANYQGGDLEGIVAKVKEGYFKSLGINTLWFSPIVQNPQGAWQEYPQPRRWFSGYHGYWPVLETKVDTRFGNDEVLTNLVESAHGNDMNVIMDFVSNHIHKENPLYTSHPDWFSGMYLPDGRVNIRIWDEQRLTTWFDDFMPDIDYTKPAAVEAFTDSAIYWLKKFNLDGFRHDATKHVSETFWRTLTLKIKQQVVQEQNRNVYQIGETFGSRELIGSYIGSGMLDAQFDFNLYFDARPVFASQAESFEKVASSLSESALYYGSHSLMGNITGNHDMPRFLYYAGGDLIPGEDEKEAGWSRNVSVKDTLGYRRLKMLQAFVTTIPGIPIIYYGDEIGMPGANDPDNRRMMKFSGLSKAEESVKSTVTRLCHLRSNSMSLCYGDTRVLKADKDVFVYLRSYFDKFNLVVMNRSGESKQISIDLPAYLSAEGLKTQFGNKLSTNGNKINIELPAISFEIAGNE